MRSRLVGPLFERDETTTPCPERTDLNNGSPFGSKRVGFINAAGDDGYVCVVEGDLHKLRGFKNNWWAYTKPDNGSGEFGYVPQTYFRGGGNFTKDAGLPDCPDSFRPQPGGRQLP
jgi:hypothetical protein